MPTKAQPAGAGLTAAQLAAFRDARKKHLLAKWAKGGRLTREEKVEVAEFMPGAAPAPKGKPTKRRPAPRAKAEEAPAPAAPEPASIAPRPVAPPAAPRDWAGILETYVSDVLAGNIPAGKWLRLACERHRRDMERAGDPAWPFAFDAARVGRVCRFSEMLPHVKGEWARPTASGYLPRIHLEPWQVFVIGSLFGWVKRTTGRRRFRHASIYVARKNGKSTLASLIAWWMFAKDDEPGAEVYSGATSMAQANEVFKPAWQMAKKCPELVEGLGVQITASKLLRMADAAKFEPVIGKPGDGASPHCAIVDEYHEHDTSDLHDTMLTGMGAREQPLLLIISTAGSNLAGPCREDWKSCETLLTTGAAGTTVDDTRFALIYAADPEDDWTSVEAARKANPNFGVSVSAEFLAAQVVGAVAQARQQSAVKTKHLNLWVTAKHGYFDTQKVITAPVSNPALKLADFAGRTCYIGVDGAAVKDISAVALLFPDPDGRTFTYFGRYYLPRATVMEPTNQHYRTWETQGWLTVCEGSENDFDRLELDVVADTKLYDVRMVAFDPWQLRQAVGRWRTQHGIPCVEVPPFAKFFSEPMKRLDGMIASGRFQHPADPVLMWALSNVVAKEDSNQNVKPEREGEAQKIDPAVALLMAMNQALAAPVASSPAGFLFV